MNIYKKVIQEESSVFLIGFIVKRYKDIEGEIL